MTLIDKYLNQITMYKLVLYGLFILSGISIVLSYFDKLSYSFSGFSMILSLVVIVFSCYLSNLVFSKVLKIPVNAESSIITALILFLIMAPAGSLNEMGVVVLTGVIAMASKYVIAPFRKHIFNPAAFAVFVIYISGLGAAAWWVGDPWMAPFVVVLGLLVVRKIKRFSMFLSFLVAWLVSLTLFVGGIFSSIQSLWSVLGFAIFFSTIMLTEPTTTPPTRKLQVVYGFMNGFLLNINFGIGNLVSTPEFILMIGNVFSYFASLKHRLILTLREKRELAKDIYEFVFTPDAKFNFKPGQYLEWTLAHEKVDLRGNRRYFTIASSPTEAEVKLGVKYNEPPSSFKKSLFESQAGGKILAGQLAGDFVLPDNPKKKLVFLAGGIGVTPFRSMVKYLLDQWEKGGKGEKRDIVLFYSAKSEGEVAYRDLFAEAQSKMGLKVHYVVGTFVTDELLKKEMPDYRERVFYISGPEAMVNAFKKMLLKMGVSRFNIKTDYFPGFA